MLGCASPFHLAARRVARHGSRITAFNSVAVTPRRWVSESASAQSVSRTAPTAPALTSPRQPLEHVVRLSDESSTASPASGVVLRTGYHAPASKHRPESTTTTTAAISSTSYEVTDTKAFEELIRDALHIAPVAAASPPQTKDKTSSTTSTPTLLANHTIRELQVLLAETEQALATPAARKAEIDRFVYKGYLPLLKYGTFALLSLQFVVYFNWIFFVFDWNLVEPTTYFIGYTSIFCSLVYHYYRCGEDGFTWKNLFQHLAHREAEKMYTEKKVDTEAVAQLERRLAEIKAELARVAV